MVVYTVGTLSVSPHLSILSPPTVVPVCRLVCDPSVYKYYFPSCNLYVGNAYEITLIAFKKTLSLYLSRHFILVEIICANQSESKLLSLPLKFCQV